MTLNEAWAEALCRLSEAASEGPWAAEPPSREKATLAWLIRERQTGPQVGNVLLAEDAAFIVAAVNYVRDRLAAKDGV
ncbi:MAG: hypothetical protein Q8Q29_00645 [Actinomycetota bacterium]|nr:hypothetical protein [Actinomycetota bacterium]